MSFWDPQAEEPLRQYRWYINFPLNDRLKKRDIYLDELVISLKECSKPEYDISISEHKLLNHTFRYPGIVKWKPITIKFISYLNNNKENNDSAQVLADYLYVTYYSNMSPSDFINSDRERKIFFNNEDSINVITNSDFKFGDDAIVTGMTLKSVFNLSTVELIQIAGDGHELENWKLYNCWFSNVNFGNLSYDSEDFVTISATLQYDWAEKALREPRPEKPATKQQVLPPPPPPQLSPPPLVEAEVLTEPPLVEAKVEVFPDPPPPKQPAINYRDVRGTPQAGIVSVGAVKYDEELGKTVSTVATGIDTGNGKITFTEKEKQRVEVLRTEYDIARDAGNKVRSGTEEEKRKAGQKIREAKQRLDDYVSRISNPRTRR